MPENPKIFARSTGDSEFEADPRADTTALSSVALDFNAGACGVARVETFVSKDNEDRGGVVLRLTIEDHASSCVPHAVALADGIEVHIAGDAEAKAMMNALRSALASLKELYPSSI